MAFLQVTLFALLFAFSFADDAKDLDDLEKVAHLTSHVFHQAMFQSAKGSSENTVKNFVGNDQYVVDLFDNKKPSTDKKHLEVREVADIKGGTVVLVKKGKHEVSVFTVVNTIAAAGVDLGANKNDTKFATLEDLKKTVEPLVKNFTKEIDAGAEDDLRVKLFDETKVELRVNAGKNRNLDTKLHGVLAVGSRTHVTRK